MKMGLKVLVFLVSLVVIAVLYLRTPQKAFVTIVNQSGKSINIATVELCGEHANVENLSVHASKNLELKVHSDCHYRVVAVFDSGERLSNEIGYVTNGLKFYDQIIVTDSEIKLGETKAY